MSGSKTESGVRGQESGKQGALQTANARLSGAVSGAATSDATTQDAGVLEPGAATHVYPSIKNRSDG